MSRKPWFRVLDTGAVIAAGVLALSSFLPLLTTYPCAEGECAGSASSCVSSTQETFLNAVLPALAAAAVVLTFLRLREGALAVIAIALPVALWMASTSLPRYNHVLGVGGYAALVGACGGVFFLAKGSARARLNDRRTGKPGSSGPPKNALAPIGRMGSIVAANALALGVVLPLYRVTDVCSGAKYTISVIDMRGGFLAFPLALAVIVFAIANLRFFAMAALAGAGLFLVTVAGNLDQLLNSHHVGAVVLPASVIGGIAMLAIGRTGPRER